MTQFGVVQLAAVVITAAWLMVFSLRRYRRWASEPWWLLAVAMVGGAAVMRIAQHWQFSVAERAGAAGLMLGREPEAVLAALSEEMGKFAVVVFIAVMWPRRFDDPFDGVLYGTAAGLGAAAVELIGNVGWGTRPIVTTTTAAGVWAWNTAAMPSVSEWIGLGGHAIMGGLSGLGVGMVRGPRGECAWERRARVAVAAPAGLALGMAVHFGWDWVALGMQEAAETGQRTSESLRAWAVVVVAGGGAAYLWAVEYAVRRSRLMERERTLQRDSDAM